MTRLRLPLDVPGTRLDDPDTWTDCDVCDSQDHESRFATHRVHWPTGPTDKCAPCAEKLQQIAEAMGIHVDVEDLPLGSVVKRLTEKH